MIGYVAVTPTVKHDLMRQLGEASELPNATHSNCTDEHATLPIVELVEWVAV